MLIFFSTQKSFELWCEIEPIDLHYFL